MNHPIGFLVSVSSTFADQLYGMEQEQVTEIPDSESEHASSMKVLLARSQNLDSEQANSGAGACRAAAGIFTTM